MIILYWIVFLIGFGGLCFSTVFALAGIGELFGIVRGVGIFLMGLVVTIPGVIISYLVTRFGAYNIFKKKPQIGSIYLLPRDTSGVITFIGYIFVHWIFVIILKTRGDIAKKLHINLEGNIPILLIEKIAYWGSFILSLSFFCTMIVSCLDTSRPGNDPFWKLLPVVFVGISFGAPILAIIKSLIKYKE